MFPERPQLSLTSEEQEGQAIEQLNGWIATAEVKLRMKETDPHQIHSTTLRWEEAFARVVDLGVISESDESIERAARVIDQLNKREQELEQNK